MCVRQLAFVIAGNLTLLACESPLEPEPYADIPDIRSWVSGEAATYLNGEGRFILPLPEGSSRSISPQIARDQAAAFFKTFAFPDWVFGESIGHQLVAEYGDFDPATVRVSPVTYYAAASYAALPDTIPSYVKKWVGPRFINYFRLGNDIIGALASSVLNTDLWIENGFIRMPASHGGEWQWQLIPAECSFCYPISPERAVEYVGELTGVRTALLPRLFLPHRHFGASFARWRIDLEAPVVVVGDSTGNTYTTSTLYVGLGRSSPEALWIDLPNQPVEDVLQYSLPASEERRTVTLRVVEPVLFETVSLAVGPHNER